MNKIAYKLTVFTPTYNRAYTLPKLYESLIGQTEKDFEWLVIDDGSSDITQELIASYIQDQKIAIRYYKQKNGGKHRAINKGVNLANGELFFIVDSDDFLVDNALKLIVNIYKEVRIDKSFAGVCGLKVYPDMTPLGGEPNFDVIDANAIDIRFKYRVKEDLAEAFKTDILREYPFPDFKDEKFCPESLVWNRIAQNYKLRYTNKVIYICEFLDDGLTKASIKNRIKSPIYTTKLYSEQYLYNIPLKDKIKTAINYWRFAFYRNDSLLNLIKEIGWMSLPVLPLGLIFKLIDNLPNITDNK